MARYGIEFENYLTETDGRTEKDGFPNIDSNACSDCSSDDCESCERGDSTFLPWHRDGADIYEYASNIYNRYEDVLKFVNHLVNKYSKSNNLFIHSFPDGKGSSCSMHVHISPPTYHLYSNLYRFTSVFQVLFKNSPLVASNNAEDIFLSRRHAQCGWAKRPGLVSKDDFDAGNIDRTAVTKNGHGTIEFRYNDFPKSLNQLSNVYYFERIIAQMEKDKKKINITSSHIPEIKQLSELNKKIKSKVDSFFTFNKPQTIENVYQPVYENLLRYGAIKLFNNFPDARLYSFYEGSMLPIDEYILKTYDFEKSIFEKFRDEKWNCRKWSSYWLDRFNQDVPKDLVLM